MTTKCFECDFDCGSDGASICFCSCHGTEVLFECTEAACDFKIIYGEALELGITAGGQLLAEHRALGHRLVHPGEPDTSISEFTVIQTFTLGDIEQLN